MTVDGRGQEVDMHHTWMVNRTALMRPDMRGSCRGTVDRMDGKMSNTFSSVGRQHKKRLYSEGCTEQMSALKTHWRKIILTTDLYNIYTSTGVQYGAITVESWANRKRGRAATSRRDFTSSAAECGLSYQPSEAASHVAPFIPDMSSIFCDLSCNTVELKCANIRDF